jgi:hypothetical protein
VLFVGLSDLIRIKSAQLHGLHRARAPMHDFAAAIVDALRRVVPFDGELAEIVVLRVGLR